VDNFDKFFKDADVHARNKDGENALHIIAKRGKDYPRKPEHERRLFEFMIEEGLDPLAEDRRSRSGLGVAAACEQKEILELFQYRS
jgi:ankyrin repeat protein